MSTRPPEHWFHILLALADGNRHGLGIIEEITEQTEGAVQLWPGMLYVALKRMVEQGLVDEVDAPASYTSGGGRPRFYRITALGRRACTAEAARLQQMVAVARAKRVLREST